MAVVEAKKGHHTDDSKKNKHKFMLIPRPTRGGVKKKYNVSVKSSV